MDKKVDKENKAIEKQLYHLQAKRFNCVEDAKTAVQALAKKWKLHQLKNEKIKEHKQFSGKGRPKKDQPPTEIKYQVEATHEPNQDKIAHTKDQEAHYIIGSNATDLSSREIIQAYKNQSKVERGFRASIRPYVFCLLIFCQKSKAYHRISDGHALVFAYL